MKKTVWLFLFLLFVLPVSVFAAEWSPIDRTGFTAVSTSDWNDGVTAQNLMDGDLGTIWHADPGTALPISVTVDMKTPHTVTGLRFTFRESETNGFFQEGKIFKSDDGEKFTPIAEFLWSGKDPVTEIHFAEETCRYLKVIVNRATSGHAIAREFDVLTGGDPVERQLFYDEIDRTGFSLYASSYADNHDIDKAVDYDKGTYWQTGTAAPPYTVRFDMGRTALVSGISYWGVENMEDGRITELEVKTSRTGQDYAVAGTAQWSPDYERKMLIFDQPVYARYIEMTITACTGNIAAASDFEVLYDAEASQKFRSEFAERFYFTQDQTTVLHKKFDGTQEEIPTDNALLYRYNTLYIPVRTLAESAGGSVSWRGATQTVIARMGGKVYNFNVEDKRFTQGKNRFTLKDSPILINSRVYLPVSFIEEFLDYDVHFDESAKTVCLEVR